MALLPVPALTKECTLSYIPSPSSLAADTFSKLLLYNPIHPGNRGCKHVTASVAEVQSDSGQRRSQSPRNYSDLRSSCSNTTANTTNNSSSKSRSRKPSSWKPTPKRSSKRCASPKYRPFSEQDAQRGGRGSFWEVEEEESFESRSTTPAQSSAMFRIVEKLRDIQRKFDNPQHEAREEFSSSEQNAAVTKVRSRTAGELFLPKPNENLFSIGHYWSTPDHPIPAPGRGLPGTEFAWDFEDAEEEKKTRVKPPTLAELMIPPDHLRMLRTLGIALKNPLRVGRLGITDNIADQIIGQWRSSELVKVKCGGAAATNMLKIHKDLERKTGGLVIWRSGSVAVVYRGSDYDEVNKVATSLENKLDGLLSSTEYMQKMSHHAEQRQGLAESSEGNLVSNLSTEVDDLQFRMLPDQLKIDPTMDSHILSSSVDTKAFLPDRGEEVSLEDSLHNSSLDATSAVAQPTESRDQQSDHANTRSKPAPGYRRLNVMPDPFVDRDYELELDSVLEGFGPRCENWTGATPVPVDADLLSPLVPNYKPPYRLLPYGVKPHLTNNEQTDLRRLVRHITPHFVLGRNRGQQGLAAAILKLWEKSEVVKIAVKSGVQNTSSEKMAEELKRCTGGVILARDRYYITLYRGKDFLPQQVAFALTERTSMLRNLTKEDETIEGGISTINPSSTAILKQKEEKARRKAEADRARRLVLVKQLEEKLGLAVEEKRKAEKDLGLLEAIPTPVEEPADSETVTEEERYMLRRLGLKMKPFVLIGRRGIFDGVVENMHLHWKYRELVKLIAKERDRAQLLKIAKMLAKESGGILISVEGTSKGQAIIIYRGKNYERPKDLRPKTLLNKKKALERSLDLQHRESLSRHIAALEKGINKLKSSLSDAERAKHDVLDAALDELSSPSCSKGKGVQEDEQAYADTAGIIIKDVSEEEALAQTVCRNRKELLKLVKLGPIYRAIRLSNLERLRLRKLALKLCTGSKFNVGKSNCLLGLARAIRVHFLKHSLAVIGMKNRGRGTSAQDVVHELEDLTGGVLVSREQKEIIMYRGWPQGEKMPTPGIVEEVSPELMAALQAEKEEDWDLGDDVSFRNWTSDASDDGGGTDDDDVVEERGEEEEEEGDYKKDYGRMEMITETDNNDEDYSSMTTDISSGGEEDEDHLSMLLQADATGTEAYQYAGAGSVDLHGNSS